VAEPQQKVKGQILTLTSGNKCDFMKFEAYSSLCMLLSILHTCCTCITVSGVYLCKHADILQPSVFHNGQTGYLVVFKILKVNISQSELLQLDN